MGKGEVLVMSAFYQYPWYDLSIWPVFYFDLYSTFLLNILCILELIVLEHLGIIGLFIFINRFVITHMACINCYISKKVTSRKSIDFKLHWMIIDNLHYVNILTIRFFLSFYFWFGDVIMHSIYMYMYMYMYMYYIIYYI